MEWTGQMKIGVIGAGAVGSACLLSSIMRGIAREIVVVDRDRQRAKAVVTDLQYGVALSSVVQIRDGDSDLKVSRKRTKSRYPGIHWTRSPAALTPRGVDAQSAANRHRITEPWLNRCGRSQVLTNGTEKRALQGPWV